MATRKVLTNRIELIGAIYDPEILPTAVFINKTKGCSPRPSTAHGFRAGNESTLDKFLEGVEDNGNSGQEIEIVLFPFWEEPDAFHSTIDHANYWASGNTDQSVIGHCERYATKAFEDCA